MTPALRAVKRQRGRGLNAHLLPRLGSQTLRMRLATFVFKYFQQKSGFPELLDYMSERAAVLWLLRAPARLPAILAQADSIG